MFSNEILILEIYRSKKYITYCLIAFTANDIAYVLKYFSVI